MNSFIYRVRVNYIDFNFDNIAEAVDFATTALEHIDEEDIKNINKISVEVLPITNDAE